MGADGRPQRDILDAAPAVNGARIGLKLVQNMVHRRAGKMGGEQRLADLAAPLEQGLRALAQLLGTESEQGVEGVAIDVAEEGGQGVVRQRLAVGIEQRVLVPLRR